MNIARSVVQSLVRFPRSRVADRLIRSALQYVPDGPLPTRQGFLIDYKNTGALATFLRKQVISGAYEPEYLQMIRRFVKSGDYVVDVGAHEGYITLFLAQLVGNHGTVVSIEPNPENISFLEANVSVNRMQQVQIRRLAISDEQGSVAFYCDPDEGAWGSLVPFSHLAQKAQLTVQTDTLDHLFANLPPNTLHFLKLDTEGNEMKVLHGGKETLGRHQPILCFEVSLTFWASLAESVDRLLDLIRGCGYSIFALKDNRLLPFAWLDERICNLFAVPHGRESQLRQQGLIGER